MCCVPSVKGLFGDAMRCPREVWGNKGWLSGVIVDCFVGTHLATGPDLRSDSAMYISADRK